MILLDMEMPKNCVECDKIGIRAILECRLIFSGCANCGRHPNCLIKAEIPKDATNGDVIKAMFPNVVNSDMDLVDAFNNAKRWWNAQWKGQENEFYK